jgi:2-keto-4-pentenoate hydratase
MMSVSKARQAAEILAKARQNRTKVVNLPADLQPETIEEAYVIQDEIAQLSGLVGGWKASFEPKDGRLMAAPVVSTYVNHQSEGLAVSGPARVEVEFAVIFGADLPKNSSPYTREDVNKAIASAHVIFEVLGTRFEDRKLVSAHSYLADGNGNDAIIIGDAIPDWRSLDLTKLDVQLHVDGELAGQSSNGASFDKVLDLLTSLANHAGEHLGGLKAGQVVITGARVGPVAIEAGRVAEGSIHGNAKVKLRIK